MIMGDEHIDAHVYYMIDCVGGLMTRQPLRVILCRLSEKGRKEIQEIVEKMKESDSVIKTF